MTRFVLRRLAFLPLVAVGVTALLFGLTQMLSPEMRASLYIQDPRQMDALEEVIASRGLRDPMLKQYGRWLYSLAHGELGYSETAKMPVMDAIKSYLPATMELAVATMIPVVLLGLWLGTIAAVRKNKFADHFTRLVSITGYSMPVFVLGLLLLMVFYGKLRWLPPGRCGFETDLLIHSDSFRRWTGFLLADSLLNLKPAAFWDVLKHLLLPAAALCYGSMALMMRVTRSSMLEELGKDYIRTARAKGLSEDAVISRHARRNAVIPVITLSSLQFVRLLGGVVITETVFDFPGIGRWGVAAAQQLDIAGVMGFALMASFLFVAGNFAADILCAWSDPRIRLK